MKEQLDRLNIWMKLNGVPGEAYNVILTPDTDKSFKSVAYDVSGRAPYRWKMPKGPNTDKQYVRYFPTFEQLEAQVRLAIEFRRDSRTEFWRLFQA